MMIHVSTKGNTIKVSIPTGEERTYEQCTIRALDNYNGVPGGYAEAIIIDDSGVETPIHGTLDDYKGSSQIQVRWGDDDEWDWLDVTVLM